MIRYIKVRIDNYIEILYYIHTSFISTLPAVKIRIISSFINFSPSLSITAYFDYPDTVRCTYV
jgi:hypothetical protein